MLKNDQTYYKNLAVWIPKDFKVCLAIFQHYVSKGLVIYGWSFIQPTNWNHISRWKKWEHKKE